MAGPREVGKEGDRGNRGEDVDGRGRVREGRGCEVGGSCGTGRER